jgi:hypothetical protein
MFLDRILAIFEQAVIRAEVTCGGFMFGLTPRSRRIFLRMKTKEKERRGLRVIPSPFAKSQ